jgi:glycosyltransferase involved in cell wall biosynthesis
MPKISVIIPVYNTEKYLSQCLDSVWAQTFDDFEVICVNDGSTDGSLAILEEYAKKDPRIIVLTQVNQGAAAARNFAISKAQGEYLAFLDADDISLPERFARQLSFFEDNPEIGCVGTKAKIIGDDFQKMAFPTPTEHHEIEQHLIFVGCVFCQSSVMLKKSILDQNNIWYQKQYVPAEDYAFWLDLIGHTKFAVMADELVLYRFHLANISHRQKSLQGQKCAEAQISFLARYYHQNLNQEIWFKFFNKELLSDQEYVLLNNGMKEILQAVQQENHENAKAVLKLFQRKVKRILYHTHGVLPQWQLLRSPLNQTLKIPFTLRLFCFITRGVL